jgi:monoamine oxidase
MRQDGAVDADVVIVGAGLAGLSAARALTRAGADVVVLEARDRVGGRTLNEPVGPAPDQVVELGAQWVGPTQRRVLDLARDLGVPTFPTHGTGENLFEHRGTVRRYRGTIPRLNPVALADVAQAMARLNRLARRVDPESPWDTPGARRLDAMTFATWLRRNVPTAAGRQLLTIALEGVWAIDPADPSLLHVLFYIRSAGSLEALLDTEGGAQQDRFVGGSQLLALRLAEQLGDRVVLGAPVRAVAYDAGGVTVRADGREGVRARRAVIAVPPPLAGRIAYAPGLGEQRDGLTQRMAMGSVVKFHAVYDEPFWRARGLSGQGSSTTGPVKVVFDNSPPGGSPGVLLGFFEGREARLAARMPLEERRAAALGVLTRLFGPRAASPEHYVDRAWALEEHSGGCYGGYLPPGGWTDYGPALRRPAGPLHWAGAETATVWNGYMDGAVSSGDRAAAEVLAAL